MTYFADPKLNDYIISNPIEKRIAVSRQLLSTNPDRVPVIVGRAELANTPSITKNKFIICCDATFGRFIVEIRSHIPEIHQSSGLFFFLPGEVLPQASELMITLYEKHKSPDGFLYITYSCENTFG